jgi:hypothetical protein
VPDDFVATFAQQNPAGKKDILLALAIRYENLATDTELSREQIWLREVYEKLLSYAERLDLIPGAALTERIKPYLRNVVFQKTAGGAALPQASDSGQ